MEAVRIGAPGGLEEGPAGEEAQNIPGGVNPENGAVQVGNLQGAAAVAAELKEEKTLCKNYTTQFIVLEKQRKQSIKQNMKTKSLK